MGDFINKNVNAQQIIGFQADSKIIKIILVFINFPVDFDSYLLILCNKGGEHIMQNTSSKRNYCGYRGSQFWKKTAKRNLVSVQIVGESKIGTKKWGMHLNENRITNVNGIPSWTTTFQIAEWKSRGLVIWDESSKTVSNLQPAYAYRLLVNFRKSKKWKIKGIMVGQEGVEIQCKIPRRRNEVSSSSHRSRAVIINSIKLDGNRSQKLFEFLETNEGRIKYLCHEDALRFQMGVDVLIKEFQKRLQEKNQPDESVDNLSS
jgi:hypothetical protein